MQPQSNTNLYLLTGLILLGVISLLVISLYGLYTSNSSGNINQTVSNQDNSFFDNMSASVTGELINTSGTVVTLKNKSGQTRDFNVSQTTDLSKAEVGKEVIVNFIFVKGNLEVASIFPVAINPGSPPPLPPNPPPATSGASSTRNP